MGPNTRRYSKFKGYTATDCDCKYDYISWWLYDDVDHTITWMQGDYECSRDLNDVNALYDYLVETR